mmetsp:Transcript_21449/g.51842  ORF Transcript_21449/g.51842 Transcript_21449/m.51842 type:complete len:228 (+) Transcript_21449:677-1360(+)
MSVGVGPIPFPSYHPPVYGQRQKLRLSTAGHHGHQDTTTSTVTVSFIVVYFFADPSITGTSTKRRLPIPRPVDHLPILPPAPRRVWILPPSPLPPPLGPIAVKFDRGLRAQHQVQVESREAEHRRREARAHHESQRHEGAFVGRGYVRIAPGVLHDDVPQWPVVAGRAGVHLSPVLVRVQSHEGREAYRGPVRQRDGHEPQEVEEIPVVEVSHAVEHPRAVVIHVQD